MQGILSFWDLEEEVSSPTFNIVNEHKAKNVNIYHFDVYRLSGPEEFLAFGGPEYFENGICIIEWGEVIERILPKSSVKIKIERDLKNENIRYISWEAQKEGK